jgi:hypothetical protein
MTDYKRHHTEMNLAYWPEADMPRQEGQLMAGPHPTD